MTESKDSKGTMNVLSLVLVVIGIACIVGGFLCAKHFTSEHGTYFYHTNYALVTLYISGGIITGVWNFALAFIVRACKKYLDKD